MEVQNAIRFKEIWESEECDSLLSAVKPNVKVAIKEVCGEWFDRGIEEGRSLNGKWYSVEECLPPYDEEVIVLSDNINGETVPNANRISFGHRPNPDGWIGRDIVPGKVTHYEPKTYDGWNILDVKYWMFCPEIPEKNNN